MRARGQIGGLVIIVVAIGTSCADGVAPPGDARSPDDAALPEGPVLSDRATPPDAAVSMDAGFSGESSVLPDASAASCGDGIKNGAETSVDCGPGCALCPGVPAAVPTPMLLGYGAFYSSFDPALLDQQTATPLPNVVEVFDNPTSLAVALTLAKKGVLAAGHVPLVPQSYDATWAKLSCLDPASDINACVSYNVSVWKRAFSSASGFPGGFRAISVDEISISVADESSRATQIGLKTLAQVHKDFPDRRIFVWSGHCATSGATRCSVSTLTALAQNADRLMVERYLYERNDDDAARDLRFKSVFEGALTPIKNACSGTTCNAVLAKLILGLGAADTEEAAYDTDPGVDFPSFLDAQLHFIRSSTILAPLQGVAFFSYSRTRPETLVWINRLVKHYYLDRQTGLLGDGTVILKSVVNPSFETTSGWTLLPGAGGRVEYQKNDAAEVQVASPAPSSIPPRVPNGSKVLFMKRGTTPNRAVQSIAVSPLHAFHLDVYAKNQTGVSSYALAANAQVEIVDASQNDLTIFRETPPKLVHSNSSKVPYSASDHNWTRFRLEAKAPPGTTSITLVLSDAPAKPGEVTVWDFVELETLKAGSLAAGLGGLPASLDLIKNSSFEQQSLFWREQREAGNTLTGQIVASPAKSGAKALLLQTDKGTDRWLQDVFLQRPYRYRLSGWIYLQGAGANASLVIRAQESSSTAAAEYVARAKSTTVGAWQQVQVDFDMAWKLEPIVTVAARLEGVSARACFDGLRITKLTP